MNLDDLSLTPSQRAELEHVEGGLVTAWLEAAALTSGLRSPAGWFLSGVRTGALPGAVTDNDRSQAIRLAERFIATAGLFMPQAELVSELFGARGRLRHWPELETRMVDAWLERQPAAALVDAERQQRAESWCKAHMAMQALRTERNTDGHAPQTVYPSQISAALTAVSAHSSRDPDADIAW